MSTPHRTELGVKCKKCGTFNVMFLAEEGSQVVGTGKLEGRCRKCGNNFSVRPNELERANAVGGS